MRLLPNMRNCIPAMVSNGTRVKQPPITSMRSVGSVHCHSMGFRSRLFGKELAPCGGDLAQRYQFVRHDVFPLMLSELNDIADSIMILAHIITFWDL
jgi:hypothetical protein